MKTRDCWQASDEKVGTPEGCKDISRVWSAPRDTPGESLGEFRHPSRGAGIKIGIEIQGFFAGTFSSEGDNRICLTTASGKAVQGCQSRFLSRALQLV